MYSGSRDEQEVGIFLVRLGRVCGEQGSPGSVAEGRKPISWEMGVVHGQLEAY